MYVCICGKGGVSVRAWACVPHACSAHRGQKRAVDPLELSCLMWSLGTKRGFYARAAGTLNLWAFSPALIQHLYKAISWFLKPGTHGELWVPPPPGWHCFLESPFLLEQNSIFFPKISSHSWAHWHTETSLWRNHRFCFFSESLWSATRGGRGRREEVGNRWIRIKNNDTNAGKCHSETHNVTIEIFTQKTEN